MRLKSYLILFMAFSLVTACTSKKEKVQALLKSGEKKALSSDFKGALADFDQAIEYDPQSDMAWYYRANTKYNLRDMQGAMADYNESIRLNQGFADAYANRAQLKYEQGDRQGACADWHKAKDFGKENLEDKLEGCR